MSNYYENFTNEQLHHALAKAVAERDEARGAMAAQDKRMEAAGKKCGVPYEVFGCDWPDRMAEELIAVTAERDEARAHRDLAVVLYDELYTELCGANAERDAALRYIAALEDRVDSATLKAAQEAAQEEALK